MNAGRSASAINSLAVDWSSSRTTVPVCGELDRVDECRRHVPRSSSVSRNTASTFTDTDRVSEALAAVVLPAAMWVPSRPLGAISGLTV